MSDSYNPIYDKVPEQDNLPLPVERQPLRLTVYPQDNTTAGPLTNAIEQQPYTFTNVDYDPFVWFIMQQ